MRVFVGIFVGDAIWINMKVSWKTIRWCGRNTWETFFVKFLMNNLFLWADRAGKGVGEFKGGREIDWEREGQIDGEKDLDTRRASEIVEPKPKGILRIPREILRLSNTLGYEQIHTLLHTARHSNILIGKPALNRVPRNFLGTSQECLGFLVARAPCNEDRKPKIIYKYFSCHSVWAQSTLLQT